MISAIELTRDLIRFRTVNPPGDEAPCARYLAGILEAAGFTVHLHSMGENRENLVASIGGGSGLPICFSGHTDVVPLGAAAWSMDPFGGEIAGGKIYGRGSTDMKGGIAAFVCAAVKRAPTLTNTPGVVLVISAGEERGCEGANFLVANGLVPKAGAMVVAEPTSNAVRAGHKGVFWLEGRTTGITAHGSMPDQGVNAVYKAARAVLALETMDFSIDAHPVLGKPTINVGWLRGGMNVNSVPDEARFGVDLRLVPGVDRERLLKRLAVTAGEGVTFEVLGTSESVWTDPSNPWVGEVAAVTRAITGESTPIGGATYFTDAAALKPAMGNPPAVILGPGDPALAHQTDETCDIARIEQAESIYTALIEKWCLL